MALLRGFNLPQLPTGSAIEVEETFDGLELSWRNPRGNVLFRYGVALFLFFWLCGWTMGLTFALRTLFGEEPGDGARLFMLFWLGGWLVGGGLAIAIFVKLLAPGKPELLVLGYRDFRHRAGTPAFDSSLLSQQNPSKFWAFLKNPKLTETDKDSVSKVRLERAGEQHRLTVDVGSDRIEIGAHLCEPEREWVSQVLELWLQR